MATFTSVGRGRGRARNLSAAINKPVGDNQSNKYLPLNSSPATKSNVGASNELEESLVLCLKNASKDNMDLLLNKARSCATSDNAITQLVSSLCEKSIEDRDLAVSSGIIASALTDLETFGGSFRTKLLKKVQEHYKRRDELRKEFNRYLGFTTLLCSLFKWLRVNEQPLKPLTTPVYALLEELLDGNSEAPSQREEEIETFHNSLLMVASLLESCNKEKMDELFKKVRNTILKKASQKMRCLLLETLEYHASGNWTVDDDIKVYYSDLLSDILAKT